MPGLERIIKVWKLLKIYLNKGPKIKLLEVKKSRKKILSSKKNFTNKIIFRHEFI